MARRTGGTRQSGRISRVNPLARRMDGAQQAGRIITTSERVGAQNGWRPARLDMSRVATAMKRESMPSQHAMPWPKRRKGLSPPCTFEAAAAAAHPTMVNAQEKPEDAGAIVPLGNAPLPNVAGGLSNEEMMAFLRQSAFESKKLKAKNSCPSRTPTAVVTTAVVKFQLNMD